MQNAILQNSIHSNTFLGIDLMGAEGTDANDDGDADVGANNLQNYPILLSATPESSKISIVGILKSTPREEFRVEFFSNDTTDTSGFGEGQTYLGFINIKTDVHGDAPFSIQYRRDLVFGNFITCTATDSMNNTSEFSASQQIRLPQATDYVVTKGWNLISLDRRVSISLKNDLFPTAVSEAYSYSGGYHPDESIANGRGYWLKFPSSQHFTFSGVEILLDTFYVVSGWNLIGSISLPVQTASITSDPPGLVTSSFFAYDAGYLTSTTIEPRKGYWVKVNNAGKLMLGSVVGTQSSVNRIRIILTGELPPPPPGTQGAHLISHIPQRFALEQNYPNPFNPLTVISYQLPEEAYVTLRIYNLLGEEVATLVDGMQVAGFKSVEWSAGGGAASGGIASAMPSGVYIYKLTASVPSASAGQAFSEVKKMLVLK